MIEWIKRLFRRKDYVGYQPPWMRNK